MKRGKWQGYTILDYEYDRPSQERYEAIDEYGMSVAVAPSVLSLKQMIIRYKKPF